MIKSIMTKKWEIYTLHIDTQTDWKWEWRDEEQTIFTNEIKMNEWCLFI